MNTVKKEEPYSTKEKIISASVELFSKYGYTKVTMRDIAAVVGIKAGSIYHFFSSKRNILNYIYQFSVEQHRKAQPDLDELLRRAETDSPQELIEVFNFGLDPTERKLNETILLIAMHEITHDDDSAHFVEDVLFYPIDHILAPVLQRMVALGRIELFDIPAFICTVKNYCFGAAMLGASPLKTEREIRDRSFSLLFSIPRPS